MRKLGYLIRSMREDMGISREVLARGILSGSELFRMEEGQRVSRYFLLESIFQRLGEDSAWIEMTVSIEDCELLEMRRRILSYLEQGDLRQSEDQLETYICHKECNHPIHQQYYYMLKAVCCYLDEKDYETCGGYLHKGLELSWEKGAKFAYEKDCLSLQEIQLLLLQCFFEIKKGEISSARGGLDNLWQYLQSRTVSVTDAQIQCVLLQAMCSIETRDWKKALSYLEECRHQMVVQENSVYLHQVLSWSILCRQNLGLEMENWNQYYESTKLLYEVAGVKENLEDIFLCIRQSNKRELINSGDLVRELRHMSGKSKEIFSAGICRPETLGRIEHKKRAPATNKLRQILEHAQSARGFFYGKVISEDYRIYKLVNQYDKASNAKDYEKADIFFQKIKNVLDMSIPVNRQFIENHQQNIVLRQRRISPEAAIAAKEKLLRYTMPQYGPTIPRTPYRKETALLMSIVSNKQKNGRTEEALNICKQVLDWFHSGTGGIYHHALTSVLVYQNYIGLLEYSNQLEEAESIGREGLYYVVSFGRSSWALRVFANFSCIFQKSTLPKKQELGKAYLRASIFLAEFYQRDYEYRLLCNEYKSTYLEAFT